MSKLIRHQCNFFEEMEQITDFLTKLGLNAREANIYLAGLKNGSVPASFLAKECGLSRPTAYDILHKLEERGLANRLGKMYGCRYRMTNPNELQEIIDGRRQEQVELSIELRRILPVLISFQGKTIDPFPKIEFFEGKEGIKNLVTRTLQCEEKIIRAATSMYGWTELLGKEFTAFYVERRVANGIRVLGIRLKSGEINEPEYYRHSEQLREIRYAPPKVLIDASIMLFDDKVALFTTKKEAMGILLHSKSYYQTIRSWFDFLWKQSAPAGKVSEKIGKRVAVYRSTTKTSKH